MKMEAQKEPEKFKKITLTIEIESQSELDFLKCLVNSRSTTIVEQQPRSCKTLDYELRTQSNRLLMPLFELLEQY